MRQRKNRTVSIAVTPDDELKTIREAASAAGQSNSAFISAAIASALSTKGSKDQARADVDTMRRRAVPPRVRTGRTSYLVDDTQHARILAFCRDELGEGVHLFSQAVAVRTAERFLAGRHPHADPTRPVTQALAEAIGALEKLRATATAHGAGDYLAAGMAMRAKVIVSSHYAPGTRDALEKEMGRLPTRQSLQLHLCAGWLGLPPLGVFIACKRKANRTTASTATVQPGGTLGPGMPHGDATEGDD